VNGEKPPLPEARIGRAPRSRLKDPVFLNELGAALGFFGLFLMLCVLLQRDAEEIAKDPFAAKILVALIFVTFSLTVGGGIMAVERLITGGERSRSFLHHLGAMLASLAVSLVVVMLLASGITRLILPIQMFFAWLAMTAGFTLAYMTRRKKTPPT
jgi:hypothetical protein